jgi:hypothetical protein
MPFFLSSCMLYEFHTTLTSSLDMYSFPLYATLCMPQWFCPEYVCNIMLTYAHFHQTNDLKIFQKKIGIKVGSTENYAFMLTSN